MCFLHDLISASDPISNLEDFFFHGGPQLNTTSSTVKLQIDLACQVLQGLQRDLNQPMTD